MNILVAGELDLKMAEYLTNRHSVVESISIDRFTTVLKSQEGQSLVADVIITWAFPDELVALTSRGTARQNVSTAVRLGEDLERLPDNCAIGDGRKWRSIPFLILMPDTEPLRVGLGPFDDKVIRYGSNEDAYRRIEEVVAAYRERLLRELDNLGFLVSYDHGRYRVGPALRPNAVLEGELYLGVADNRRDSGRYYTVSRDFYGIQFEVEQFEALINRPDVSEQDLQRFFEENPHFLAAGRLMRPIAHARLDTRDGQVLIPDFILKPIVAMQSSRDSNWEVLDLKKPQARLLSGRGRRVRFSQDVMSAITQLRDYGDYFRNPSNGRAVRAALGRSVRYPKLAVLVGRMPSPAEVEALELAQSREADVRIVTYDEILENQRSSLLR